MRQTEDNWTNQFLKIIGRLYPDNRFVVRHSYLTDKVHRVRRESDSSLAAELVDGDGEVLLRYHLRVAPYRGDGKNLPELAVRGEIPFPPATRGVRFYRDHILVYEMRVPERKPRVRMEWKPPKSVEGDQRITWSGDHPDDLQLKYFLRYSHDDGESWRRIGFQTIGNAAEVDFDELPGGDRCKLAVVATDGVNTATDEAGPFTVPLKRCVATILAPNDGEEFARGQSVSFIGQGYSIEESNFETQALSWTSSVDGELGIGASIHISDLSPGRHKVSLTAGTGNRAGRAEINILILEDGEWGTKGESRGNRG